MTDDSATFEVGCVPGVPHPGLSCIGPNDAPGDHIVLVYTSDHYTELVPGQTGVVQSVDDAGTVHVAWDPDGHVLGLVPGVDVWREVHPRWWDAPLEEVRPHSEEES